MTIKLQGKLFLAFVLATAFVILAVAWFAIWNFDRGFREYLDKSAIERTQPIRNALVEHYQAAGGWQQLKDNPRLLRKIILQTINVERHNRVLKNPDRNDDTYHDDKSEKHRRQIFERHFREARFLRLYDEQGKLLIHSSKWPKKSKDKELRIPLVLEGKEIATLAIRKAQLKRNRIDYEFRRKQLQKLWLVVALAIVISALFAWLLARHLIGPIQALAEGTKAIGDGDYKRRVTVKGNDELASLSRDFNQLASTLEQNEQSRQQWIADISHELRTPLAVLRGEIEAVIDGVRKFDADNVQSLHEEVLALGQLVEDLYQLALSDAGALDYRFENENVKDLLEVSLDAFALRYSKAGLSFESRGLGQLNVFVRADRKRFSQLMHNLLENSLRYTDSGGQVILEAKVISDLGSSQLLITLSDSSPCVSDDELPKIFERLYRVDQSRSREHGGSGLGLSLCQNIVAAHGGKIEAAKSELGGVEIKLCLPIVEQ